MSTLKVTNIQDTAGGNSSTSAQIYSGRAKAWVNFDGTNTVAIRASFNVSSITDGGTGNYQVNFTSSLPSSNYAACGTVHRNGSGRVLNHIDQLYTQTASAYKMDISGTINSQVVGLSPQDVSYVYISFFDN